MALSILVSLNGTVMSGARVPFAMSRDGYFFKAMAESIRISHAAVALMVQLALSVALLLFAGSFRQLFSLAIFAEWLFYMIAASTVFVLRRKERMRRASVSGIRLQRRSKGTGTALPCTTPFQ